MKLNSIYVSAKDFNRAKKWYQEILLQRKPDNTTDRFAFWKLGEVHFGVFNPEMVEEQISFGNNCVPNIEVEDVDKLYDRLREKNVEIVMERNDVNGTRIFQCYDSEKNVIEFYHWIDK